MYTIYNKENETIKYCLKLDNAIENIANVYLQPPKISYKTWFNKCVNEQKTEFIVFHPNTHIAKNYLVIGKRTKQPYVQAILEVLKSIKLNKDYTYLNIYAGGNKAKVMPFYRALELLGNLEYTYQIDNLFEKKMYPVNIDTLDNAYNTRSRYKIDYLDYTPNKYNVILGAVQPHLFTKVYKKALKEAQNYVILFSAFFTDIKCNYIYKINEGSCFYVWDIHNLEKPMFHRKIKNNKISKFDYTKLTWAHTIQ